MPTLMKDILSKYKLILKYIMFIGIFVVTVPYIEIIIKSIFTIGHIVGTLTRYYN